MNDKSKTITAKEMNRTGRGFRDAFLGNTVKINHNHFPDGIFELTYRPRRACFSDEPKPIVTVTEEGKNLFKVDVKDPVKVTIFKESASIRDEPLQHLDVKYCLEIKPTS